MSIPTRDQIDEYIASVEEYISSSFASVAPDIPAISDSIHQLWVHVSRFGPPEMPDLRLPGLGSFELPAPPPPPPPPPPVQTTWFEDVANWSGRNKKLLVAVAVGAVGAGLLAGYSASAVAKASASSRRVQRAVGSNASTRRLIVVVLGGDTPLGRPVIAGLEKEGYIVITSVSHPDTVTEVEAKGNGYVRALVFDPSEPSTLQPFLRSLKATLTLRFPLNTAGDPYQHSSVTFPILHSVVSLLTLPTPINAPTPSPFEHLDLISTYESYVTQTHTLPLQAIQALLPLFRFDSARSQDASYVVGGRKSVVICVPAMDARVGVPYASAQAMSAAATVRGAEVLRRELAQVATHHMRDLRIVVVDVGVVGKAGAPGLTSMNEQALMGAIAKWTASEQKVYSAPYLSYMAASNRGHAREPTSVNRFVRTLVNTVGRNTAKGEPKSTFIIGMRLWAQKLHWSIRGDRFSVGAGAATYTIASYLPTSVLDVLLNLPAFLVSVRNRYLPISPHIISPMPPPIPPEGPIVLEASDDLAQVEAEKDELPAVASPSTSASEHLTESSSSETHVQSTCAESSHPSVESSWVSVQD